MFVIFTNNESEVIEGADREITYHVTIAGQRYKADGTEGALITKTFITKNYDDGMFDSKEIADYIDGKWVPIPDNEPKKLE